MRSRILFGLLAAACAYAQGPLIPAGTLVNCTIGEKISSKIDAVGDPVVCSISRAGMLPYGSLLTGDFADYKDPGHFYGKGWMQLNFDRILVGHSVSVPVAARVVDVYGYRIDNEGRILGKGAVARDIARWMIPILWPYDLLTIPKRGPRPSLKAETRIVVKLMEDIQLPAPPVQQAIYDYTVRYPQQPEAAAPPSPAVDQYGFVQRPAYYAPLQSPVDSYGGPLFTPAQMVIMAAQATASPAYGYYPPPPPPARQFWHSVGSGPRPQTPGGKTSR